MAESGDSDLIDSQGTDDSLSEADKNKLEVAQDESSETGMPPSSGKTHQATS